MTDACAPLMPELLPIVREAGGVFDMPWQDAVRFGAPARALAANPLCYGRDAETVRLVKN